MMRFVSQKQNGEVNVCNNNEIMTKKEFMAFSLPCKSLELKKQIDYYNVLPLVVSGGLKKTDFRLTTKFNKNARN